MADEKNNKAEETGGIESPPQKHEGEKKSSSLMLLLLILLLVVLTGVGGYVYLLTQSKTEASVKKVESEIENLKVGITGNFTLEEINPLKDYDENAALFRNVYGSLVVFDENNQLKPELAISWSNPDDKTWNFKLRNGVKFSDGKAFTAEDVKYSLDTIQADVDSGYNEYFSDIKSATVISPYELELKTEEPSTYLLSKLTYLFVVPNGTKDTTFKNALGTGPFTYSKTETVVGQQLVLDRNSSYWGGASKAKKVTFKVYNDEEAGDQKISDFKAGLLDITDAQTPDEIAGIKTVANTHQQFVSDLGVFFLYLNNTDDYAEGNIVAADGKNPMKDKRVRMAIWQALDTNALVEETMNSMAIPATEMIPNGVYGYDPKLARPKYDIAAAKALMKEAGYENGFKVNFYIVSVRENVGEYIKAALKEINIDVSLEVFSVEDFGDYAKLGAAHKQGLSFGGWTEETKDGQNMIETLFTASGQNYSGYESPELSDMVAKMANTTNQAERKGDIMEALKFLNEEVPSIPLFSKKNYVGVRNDIKWTLLSTTDYYFYDAAKLTEVKVEEEKGLFQNIFQAVGL